MARHAFAALLDGAVPAIAGDRRGLAGRTSVSSADVKDEPASKRSRPAAEGGSLVIPEAGPRVATFAAAVAPPSLPVAGTGSAMAETAALAERFLTSLRVGRVGRDGVEVRLRLRRDRGDEIEIRMRETAGRLEAELIGEGPHAELAVLAARLEGEMRARGYGFDTFDVTAG